MWWRNGTPEQDQLNSYWDAAVSGAAPEAVAQAPPDLDPNLQEAIAQVRALHRRRRPDPAFALHLETTLMNAFATSNIATPVIRPVRQKQVVPRPAWLPGREQELPRRWGLGALATVALIALVLAAFFFALRGPDQPAIVPGTPDGSPTAVPAPTTIVEPVSMYRGGLDRTGVMPGPAPTGRPGVLWRAETEAVIEGPVAVGAGLVYTGTDDGSVHAFDMTTGAEVWKLTANATIESLSIVLDGATAYIAGFDGMVLAVDAATGKELWRTDPALNVSRRVAFDADTNTLYVAGLNPVSYAFDSTTGSLKWQAPISAPQRSVASVVAGDTLYFGTSDGLLYALNTADGSTKWTWDSEHDVLLSLLFATDTIFVPTIADRGEFAFVAIDAVTGTEKWRQSSTLGQYTAGAIIDGNVIFGTDFGKVMSVAAADGHVNWTFAPGNGAVFRAPPAFVDNDVYVFDTDGSLYALDAATGGELWRVTLDSGNSYNPAITGGVIYLTTPQGSVYALGDGGTELPAATPVTSPATVATAPVASPVADAAPGTAKAETAEGVEVVWETTGGAGGLSGATQLSVAPDGTIWVADPGKNGFQIFDAEGEFLEIWTGPADDPFNFVDVEGNPFGAVAFAPDGSFYVLDYGNRQVVSFSADRTLLSRFGGPGRDPGQFAVPNSISVDPAGNAAVWDPGRGDVQTFAPDGTLVSTVRLQSTYTGGYSSNAMTMDGDGNYYIVEFDQVKPALVEKFDPEGNLLQQFGLEPGPGVLKGQPLGLGLDPAGNIYVTAIESSQVVVFAPDGEFLIEFGATGDKTIEFLFPFDVAADAQGGVYVTDGAQSKLVKVRLPESLVPATGGTEPNAAADDVELVWEASGGDGILSSLALAPDGTIWVADIANHGFQIFDTEGNFVESWTGTGDGQFRFMRASGDPFNAITFAADGSFYVLDPDKRRIQAFTPDRTFLRSIGEPGREPGQFLEPIDVVIDPAGNLAVLDDARGDIQAFAPDGTLVSTIPLQSTVPPGPNMNSMTFDAEGNYYVAELSEDVSRLRVVEKFDPQGNLLQQFGIEEGSGRLASHPGGIAVDRAGNVYVVETGENPRVLVFAPDGEYLTEFGGPGSPTFALESPWDVALDGQGNVYVTDGAQNRLFKLSLPQTLVPATPTP